jgi:carotenoid 1,2-hydratase
MRDQGPDFSLDIAKDGYAWWYVDAMSHDGRYGLTIIAFIGSVFSPYYKWARRKQPANPFNHCAINVALYGPRGRWAMTERGANSLQRSDKVFSVGPSHMRWDKGELIIDICETSAPIPLPVRGEVRLRPRAVFDQSFALDPKGQHHWQPIAPLADVSVEMTHPGLSWQGTGYFDHNHGHEPLEAAFTQWDWSRAHHGADTVIHYDASLKDGSSRELALRLKADGEIEHFNPPPRHALPMTLWRIDRFVRSDAQTKPQVIATLEDTPFYARSTVKQWINGEELTGFHERLRLDRFCSPIVQMMLPFRMPRLSAAKAGRSASILPDARSQSAPSDQSPN